VGFAVLLWMAYGIGLAPALDASSSGRAVMHDARSRIGPEAQLGLVAWREQHLLQAVGPTEEFGFEREFGDQWQDAVLWLSEAPAQRWLFALEEVADACVDRDQLIALGRSSRRSWVLVPGAAYQPGCVPPSTPTSLGEHQGDRLPGNAEE